MNEVFKTWYSSNLIYTYGEVESSFNSSLYNRLNNVRISINSCNLLEERRTDDATI